MKTLIFALLTFGFIIHSLQINGQSRNDSWCGTDQYMQEKHGQTPAVIQQNLVKEYLLNNKIETLINNKKPITIIIPVVWHVVSYNGSGYVSKADIDDQMLTINEDFQRLNADTLSTRPQFLPYAANIQVEFRLAHLDPNGNCTEGIVRVESPLAMNAGDAVKAVSYWDSKKYFNIWTVISMASDNPPFITLGYAQFPNSGINNTYGVVMRHNYVSRTDRTLSHEIGHCFGLYHTFQSGCGNSCSTSGDGCCDTPPVDVSTQGCVTTQNSCSNDASGPDPWGGIDMEDQIENFMSYDACQNMFSLDQKTRMYTYLNSTSTTTGLAQLSTSSNLTFTGVNNPYGVVICTPIADFSYDKEFICEGDVISFTDNSYNATPTAWNWTFTGGTPSSSTSSNPTISYNTAGVYDVTHQPSTATGSDLITKTGIITVSSLIADYVGPLIDGFENTTQFNNDWRIYNGNDAFNWTNTTTAAATGTHAIMIENSNAISSGTDIDYIVSPSYDISTATLKTMTFKQAFAKKTADNTDRLMVYYSINCGKSWNLKLPLTASVLPTAPDNSGFFIPSSSEWVERTIDLTPIGTSTNVKFKFEFTSGGGNNIYIDDINIGGVVGIDEFNSIASFSIYPNPTNSNAQISFHLIKDVKNLSIKVKNAVGQELTKVINNQSFNSGKYTLRIDEQRKLAAGIYFIEFNVNNNIRIEKLIVQ